jgi:hypothetical protein
MFEITGGIPGPIIENLKEAKLPGNMTGLDWKSDAAVTGHPPVTKREREIRLNGIGGVKFQKPGSRFRSGFLFIEFVLSKPELRN